MLTRANLLIFSCLWACVWGGALWAAEPLALQSALNEAYASNPAISAAQAKADGEHAAIRSEASLDDPRIGFMREVNLNFMEQVQGPMNTWVISQDVKFPAKYFFLAKAQSARASEADELLKQKKLEVRSSVIAQFYNLFAVDRILALLDAQRETLREISRTAESRYATGSVPQQDEMKAHMEQTELEKDVLILQQERETTQAALDAALGREESSSLDFKNEELQPPRLSIELAELSKMAEHHSRHIKQAQAGVEESQAMKRLAQMRYAPDFSLSYRRAFGSYSTQNAYATSIEMSIPLWFFAKQSGETSAASARAFEAEKNLEAMKLEHASEVNSLVAKVQATGKMLSIYQTGLIPQGTSTLNSSRASYRAGRTSLIELLDSERSLYAIRIAYYRTLAQYSEQVAKLEEVLGESVSSLPFGDLQ